MHLRTFVAVTGYLLCGISIGTSNQTISWSADAISLLYDSEGQEFPDSWTIALGTFGDTFTPDENNTADWSSNWVELDTTNYTEVNPPFSSFSSTVVISDTDLANQRVYMWFYNNQTGNTTSEWALISDSMWNVATEAELGLGQGGPNDTWVMQDAGTVVWGGLNNTPSTGGVRSVDPVTYDLQTHTFEDPIPEPSVSLVLGLGIFILGSRRKRVG